MESLDDPAMLHGRMTVDPTKQNATKIVSLDLASYGANMLGGRGRGI